MIQSIVRLTLDVEYTRHQQMVSMYRDEKETITVMTDEYKLEKCISLDGT